jgi:hypothetical protein
MSRLPTTLRCRWEKAIANGSVPPEHAAAMRKALDEDEPSYQRRLRVEAHGEEAVALADAFLNANPDCAF